MRHTLSRAANTHFGTRRSRGRTLLELVIVLAITMLLLSQAVPAMHAFIGDNRIATATNRFIYALALARSAAAKRGQRVAVCPADHSAPSPHCAADAGWEDGWLIFVDLDDDGQFDADEPLLFTGAPAPATITIRGNRYVSRYVSYTPLGNARLHGGALQMGTVVVCDQRGFGSAARAVILNAAGRVRTTVATASGKSSCDP